MIRSDAFEWWWPPLLLVLLALCWWGSDQWVLAGLTALISPAHFALGLYQRRRAMAARKASISA